MIRTCRVPLRNRNGESIAYALIDATDAPVINQHRWSLHPNGYAVRVEKRGGKRRTVLMHRQVMGEPEGEVDHINLNRLDNRRANLRVCSHLVNCQNRAPQVNNTSGFAGVTWDKGRGKWRAQIGVCGKMRNLGRYDTKAEAAAAYQRAKAEAIAALGEAA